MKLIAKSVAIALLSTASVSAFAITIPTLPTGTAGPLSTASTGGGLWVEVFDESAATPITLLEYLGLNYVDINKATATPAGGLSLDFGVLGGTTSNTWSSFFKSTDTVVYAVFDSGPASTSTSAGTYALNTTLINGTQNLTATNLVNAGNNINQLSSICPTGLCIDPQGTTGYVGGTSGAGQLSVDDGAGVSSGFTAAGAVGTMLEMFQVTKHTASSSTVGGFTNASGTGEWLLSANGDLTYNIPGSAPPVPLPAAAWLLASGLLGLAGVSRRKVTPVSA